MMRRFTASAVGPTLVAANNEVCRWSGLSSSASTRQYWGPQAQQAEQLKKEERMRQMQGGGNTKTSSEQKPSTENEGTTTAKKEKEPLELTLQRRIRSPIDHVVMSPLDQQFLMSKSRTTNIALVTWLMPAEKLQNFVHSRYQVEELAYDQNNVPYGILSVGVGLGYPEKQGMVEAMVDPAPHPFVVVKTSVVDRIFWQRTAWNFRTYTNSLYYGKFANMMYGADIQHKKPVIDANFDAKQQRFVGDYKMSIPSLGEGAGIELELEDTGVGVLDPKTRVIDGFTDNESALRVLTMHREVNMRANEGQVYRQPTWSPFVQPNVATVKKARLGSELIKMFKFDGEPETPPIAAWLLDEIPVTELYSVEGHVEDENDPASMSKLNQRTFGFRVVRRGMNRRQNFRDEVREKVYSDMAGNEVPRV